MDYSKNQIEINKDLKYKILSNPRIIEDLGEVIFHLNLVDTPLDIIFHTTNILIISNEKLEIRINTQTGQLYYKPKNKKAGK